MGARRSWVRGALVASACALGSLGVATGSAAADTSCPDQAGAQSVTFSYTGAEQTCVVPAGVTSVSMVATGGAGGYSPGQNGDLTRGGQAAVVSGSVTVTPGQPLYVEVGGAGAPATSGGAGGFNGGGNGSGAPGSVFGAGGGGGASDVRTEPASVSLSDDDSRLIVAAGGGGGGDIGFSGNDEMQRPGGPGGPAGAAGGHGTKVGLATGGAGGSPGTAVGGGSGGIPGGLGYGGDSSDGGGAGGGGLYGGGSGYPGGGDASEDEGGAGGGGGGSSLVPADGSYGGLSGSPAQVQISYTVPASSLTQTGVQCVAQGPFGSPPGTPQTCEASVTDDASGGVAPTGTVQFSSDGPGSFGPQASCTLTTANNSIGASCEVTYTPGAYDDGSQTITATYSGDPEHASSSATTTVSITELQANGKVKCAKPTSAQLAKVQQGKSISLTCTATETRPTKSAPQPTGTVSFSANPSSDPGESVSPASCTLKLVSGVPGCHTTFKTATPDTYTLAAQYGGDDNYAPASSAATTTITTSEPTSSSTAFAPRRLHLG